MTLANKPLSLGIKSLKLIDFVCCCVQVLTTELEITYTKYLDVVWTVDLRLI